MALNDICMQAHRVVDIAPMPTDLSGAVLRACAQWGHQAEEASGLLQESWDLAGSKMDRSRGVPDESPESCWQSSALYWVVPGVQVVVGHEHRQAVCR